MMKKITGIVLCFLLAVVCHVQSAHAVSVKGVIKGQLKSGGTGHFTGPGTQIVIAAAAVPDTMVGSERVLVVTDVCFYYGSAGGNYALFSAGATPLVTLSIDNQGVGSKCNHFEPGFLVPEGSDLTCTVSGGSTNACSATGIVAKP